MRPFRLLMGLLYIAAGTAHLVLPRPYQSIVPDYLPAHHALVLVSGLAEIAGGAGIFVPATRRAAAWGLIALLVAVFPANLWMAQHAARFAPMPAWALWARLPLQLPLIAWAWRYTRPD